MSMVHTKGALNRSLPLSLFAGAICLLALASEQKDIRRWYDLHVLSHPWTAVEVEVIGSGSGGLPTSFYCTNTNKNPLEESYQVYVSYFLNTESVTTYTTAWYCSRYTEDLK